ncbi:MAG: hypothetical protein JWR16_355 [Nevskia sp.]|nr:hypothetical protein [Nevskia sp.]
MSGKFCIALGGLYGFLAVVLGAIGAHALKAHATDEVMALYRTANSYHFYHALALVGAGVVAQSRASIWLKISGACFALGVLLFCGSLYALALAGVHATLAPFGGVLLMIGWVTLAVSALRPSAP